MGKMVEACVNCPVVSSCYINDFKSCPRIEIAAAGLGVPVRPKKVEDYIENIPFGVYMGLKHILAKHNKELERVNRLKQGIRDIAWNDYRIPSMSGGIDIDGDVAYGRSIE